MSHHNCTHPQAQKQELTSLFIKLPGDMNIYVLPLPTSMLMVFAHKPRVPRDPRSSPPSGAVCVHSYVRLARQKYFSPQFLGRLNCQVPAPQLKATALPKATLPSQGSSQMGLQVPEGARNIQVSCPNSGSL